MTARTAEIKLTIELDADSLPGSITWQASDARHEGAQRCQAMMLSVWDNDSKTIAAIDLWTPQMTVADMNTYFCQAFHKMADTYSRATKDTEIADSIHDFGDRFARMLGARSAQPDRRGGDEC
jgi:gliding motility-associated protein GldC